MEMVTFIVEEGFILIPVLYIIGEIIRLTTFIHSKWIPLLLLLVSLGFTPLVIGGYTPDNIVQAILIAGVTVFGDQLIKQSRKESS